MKKLLLLATVLPLLLSFTHGAYPPPYTGAVATRARVNDVVDTTNKQLMARSAHFSRSVITSVQILAQNFARTANGPEAGPGGIATVKVSIEYPEGVCTSAVTDTVADATTKLLAPISVTIPTNTQFWVRQYITNAAGLVYDTDAHQDTSIGDSMDFGVSGITDSTVSCASVSNTSPGNQTFPLAIVSTISIPSVCILGDSIVTDGNPNTIGDTGSVARSIGPFFGYVMLGRTGTAAESYVLSSTASQTAYPYCSHMIVEYGRNDFAILGSTAAQLQANLTSIYSLFPRTAFQTTITPDTTSSDDWATTTGQTVKAWESERVTFNSALRAGSFGPSGGFFDTALGVETAANSGFWKSVATFPQCAPWTPDGIHPSGICAQGWLQASNYINVQRIRYP